MILPISVLVILCIGRLRNQRSECEWGIKPRLIHHTQASRSKSSIPFPEKEGAAVPAWLHSLVVALERGSLAPGAVQIVQLAEGALCPDAETPHVAPGSQAQQVQLVHVQQSDSCRKQAKQSLQSGIQIEECEDNGQDGERDWGFLVLTLQSYTHLCTKIY